MNRPADGGAAAGVYYYCITPVGHRPDATLRGVDARPVVAFEIGSLAVWASEMAVPPTPSLDRARDHNEVIAAAATPRVTPVPVRFGQWARSQAELEARVLARGAEYEEMLRMLAGALEFGVRILDPRPAAPPPGRPLDGIAAGRAYMDSLARRAAVERAAATRGRALAGALRAALGGLSLRDRVDPTARAGGLVSIAHLVGRADFERYRAGVQSFACRHGGLRFAVSGPWPPYSFVS